MRRVAVALLALAGCGRSGGYPDRPILLVCPWAAGGGSDRVARQVAALLEQDLKVPVNVQNQTGGEGVTGHSAGAMAAPDGYTLTLMTVEINMLHWRGLTRLDRHDFSPALLLNRDAAAVFVRTEAPWKTLQEMEERVRKGPTRLRAAGTAAGGIWHLGLGGWLSKVGLQPSDIVWVSIPGAAPSLQELMAGGLDLVACSLPEARSLLDAGKVRCLAVMAPERLAAFPDVPTLKEQGTDWSMGAWRGIGLPRATPKAVADKVVAALERVAKSGPFLEYMKNAGHGAACEPPPEFEKSLRETDALMGSFLTRPEFRTMTRGRVGPMAFPAILGGTLVLAVLGLAVAGRWRWEAASAMPRGRAALRIFEVVLWVALYLAFADLLGFVLTAGGLLLAFLLRCRVRPPVAAAIAVLLVPATYHLFAVLLRVALPRGLVEW